MDEWTDRKDEWTDRQDEWTDKGINRYIDGHRVSLPCYIFF